MSFKIIVQTALALMVFICSTFVAWYEGSQLLTNSLEWKYTTYFSEMFNGPVNQASDILTMDYFVYAAKFAPAFPLLMLFSGTYLLMLLGYFLFKDNHIKFTYFLICMGVLFLALSAFVSNSPTTGLKLLFSSLLTLGIVSIAFAFLPFFRIKKREITKSV